MKYWPIYFIVKIVVVENKNLYTSSSF